MPISNDSQDTRFHTKWSVAVSVNFHEKKFRDNLTIHENHENLHPQKFATIRYIK